MYHLPYGSMSTEQDERMYRALRTADKKEVNKLLRQGFDLNQVTVGVGDKALHLAAGFGNLDMVRFLVDRNADVRIANVEGATPLHVAARRGHLEIAQFLIHNRADVCKTNSYGCTPLCVAAFENHTPVIKLLTSQPNINWEQEVPLHWACLGYCRLDTIRFLVALNPGAVRYSDEEGCLPLHHACYSDFLSVEVIQFLMQRYPEAIHHRSHSGRTPLNSILEADTSILKWLKADRSRTILSLQQDFRKYQAQAENWDLIVALLWCHFYGFDKGQPPRIADTSRLSPEEFKNNYQWMIHAACSLIHVDGDILEQLFRVFGGEAGLVVCPHTGKTPLVTALQSVQRCTSADKATMESTFQSLVSWSPLACRLRDVNNNVPLAYAINVGLSLPIIDLMLKTWPASVLEKTANGLYMFELAGTSNCSESVIFSLLRSGILVQRLAEEM